MHVADGTEKPSVGKREVIGTSVAAKILGVSQRQAQRIIVAADATGEIPIIGRLGSRGDYIVSRDAVERYKAHK